MGQIEDSAAGIRLAKAVALATARDDEPEVLRLVNSADEGSTRWAIAYMGGMVAETFIAAASGDRAEGLRRLEEACAEDSDVVDTQLRIMERGEN